MRTIHHLRSERRNQMRLENVNPVIEFLGISSLHVLCDLYDPYVCNHYEICRELE